MTGVFNILSNFDHLLDLFIVGEKLKQAINAQFSNKDHVT